MNIKFFEGSHKDYLSQFSPIPDKDLERLNRAIKEAISRGSTDDMLMIVTFSSSATLPDHTFDTIFDEIQANKDVKRIATMTTDNIILLTKANFIVTLKFIGAKQYHHTEEDDDNDSFESVESLTQKVKKLTEFSSVHSGNNKKSNEFF